MELWAATKVVGISVYWKGGRTIYPVGAEAVEITIINILRKATIQNMKPMHLKQLTIYWEAKTRQCVVGSNGPSFIYCSAEFRRHVSHSYSTESNFIEKQHIISALRLTGVSGVETVHWRGPVVR